jgi:predicted transcriptional regulator
MIQENFKFGVPKTGNNCPETSYEAAHKMRHSAQSWRMRILKFIRGREHIGATADEVHVHFGEEKNTTSPRITELKDAGLVRKTEIRRTNAKGNKGVVWIAN